MSWDDVESWTVPDGARLAARRLAPEGAARGTAILVHGWGEHAGRYAHVAAWLAGRGLAVVGYDHRGHGRSSGRRGDVARFAQFVADLVAVRRRVQAERPGPVLLLGHSFGGLVVLRYLETAHEPLAGAVCSSPYLDVAFPVPRWKAAFAHAAQHVLPALRAPTGLPLDRLCTDPAVVRAAVGDPQCHQLITPRAYHEILAAQRAVTAEAGRIGAPLLFLLAGDDRIVSTAATQAFAAALPARPPVHVYAGLYHEILNEREPDRARVLADLAPWLDHVLAEAA